MTTPSDAISAARTAAAADSPQGGTPDSPAARHARDARARVAVTDGDGKGSRGIRILWADFAGSGLFDMHPPSLRELRAGRTLSADQVPDGSEPLRQGGTWWNTLVGLPAAVVLYTLAWVLQHPARALLAVLLISPVTLMWITF